MTQPPSKLLKITQKSSTSQLSRGQKLFKSLIKKLEVQRAGLLEWQGMIPVYLKKHTEEFTPLLTQFNVHRTELVLLFDRACDSKSFSQSERKKLVDLILTMSTEVLSKTVTPELKAIYNKYSDDDFDTEDEEMHGQLQAMMEEMFGAPFEGDLDMRDPEAMLRMMAEQAQKTFEQRVREEEENPQPKKKKSAKQLAKESKLEEEEKNISLSIREVFRKLASALHPDRETDPAERARKTELMQKVNVAYGNKDLLQLLELQLEVEQINADMINDLSDDRLKHYNKILAEQLGELELEVEQMVMSFSMRFQIEPMRTPSPSRFLLNLTNDIQDLQDGIATASEDTKNFEDTKKLKAWLKTYRIPRNEFDFSDLDEEEFAAMFFRR